MGKQSCQYERAKAMVLNDKFNYNQTEFSEELYKLVSKYMEFDALTVETNCGSTNNLIINISVKKVKPIYRARL